MRNSCVREKSTKSFLDYTVIAATSPIEQRRWTRACDSAEKYGASETRSRFFLAWCQDDLPPLPCYMIHAVAPYLEFPCCC